MRRDYAAGYISECAGSLRQLGHDGLMAKTLDDIAATIESNSWDDDPPSPGATEKGGGGDVGGGAMTRLLCRIGWHRYKSGHYWVNNVLLAHIYCRCSGCGKVKP